MTDVIVTSKDVIVEVQQPTLPPTAPPPKVGLVEINQVVQRGSAWITGSGPPTLAGGQFGDMYLDIDTGDVYLWTGTGWDYQGTFAPSTLTPEEILAALITVDGAGSNLDADLLDGQHGAYYATQSAMTANNAHDVIQDDLIQGNTNDITANTIAIDNLSLTIGDETTPANILAKIKTVDGPGSGLDADTLDGHDSTYFATAAGLTAETSARTSADTALDARITTEKNRNDAQDTAIGLRLTDAPSDANAYGRKAAAWVDVTEEAPNDGLGYMRKNGAWTPSSGGAWTDDAPPAGPLQDGQFWWKSSTGALYLWYVDANSSQWVMASASPQVIDNNYTRKTANTRNLIVNPAMMVSQENNISPGNTNGYYAADQWSLFKFGGASFNYSRINSKNAPSGSPFRLRVQVTAPYATVAAGDLVAIYQSFEGYQVNGLGWGNVGANPSVKDAVLRFGVCAPAGTYHATIAGQQGKNYSFPALFTITAAQANTDQVIEIPIPGKGNGFIIDNTVSFTLTIVLQCGTDNQATAANQWGTLKFATAAQSNLFASPGAIFELFDVGLYVDPGKTGLAPPFEIPDPADDLARCQRYYRKYIQHSVYTGYASANNGVWGDHLFAPSMRTTPTVVGLNVTFANCTGLNGTSTDYQHVRLIVTATVAGVTYFIYDLTANARM